MGQTNCFPWIEGFHKHEVCTKENDPKAYSLGLIPHGGRGLAHLQAADLLLQAATFLLQEVPGTGVCEGAAPQESLSRASPHDPSSNPTSSLTTSTLPARPCCPLLLRGHPSPLHYWPCSGLT